MTEHTNVTALPIVANVDAAWARYTALIGQSIADPNLLLDRDYSAACVRAWASFRDLLIAHDAITAEATVVPTGAAFRASPPEEPCRA